MPKATSKKTATGGNGESSFAESAREAELAWAQAEHELRLKHWRQVTEAEAECNFGLYDAQFRAAADLSKSAPAHGDDPASAFTAQSEAARDAHAHAIDVHAEVHAKFEQACATAQEDACAASAAAYADYLRAMQKAWEALDPDAEAIGRSAG